MANGVVCLCVSVADSFKSFWCTVAGLSLCDAFINKTDSNGVKIGKSLGNKVCWVFFLRCMLRWWDGGQGQC